MRTKIKENFGFCILWWKKCSEYRQSDRVPFGPGEWIHSVWARGTPWRDDEWAAASSTANHSASSRTLRSVWFPSMAAPANYLKWKRNESWEKKSWSKDDKHNWWKKWCTRIGKIDSFQDELLEVSVLVLFNYRLFRAFRSIHRQSKSFCKIFNTTRRRVPQ